MKIEFATPMQAPQGALFDALSDPTLRPQWQRSLRRVKLHVEEPPALGNRWREWTKLGPAFEMETIVFERPHAWSEKGGGGGVSAELHVTLSQDGDGTCLALTLILIPPALLGPLMRPILPLIERELRGDLERLDRLSLQGPNARPLS